MNTSGIIRHTSELLRRIGSSRDPLLFQAMRQFVRSADTMNRTVIVNWGTPDRRHGCRFDCSFCSWRDRAEATGDVHPSRGALAKFVSGFEGYLVTVSGGGDPLYRLEENLPRLREIADVLHAKGLLVEVITMEWDLVAEHAGGLLDFVDMWSFSSQTANSKVLAATEAAVAADKLVRVSRVCTPGQNMELHKYAMKMRVAGAHTVILREDFNHVGQLSKHDAAEVARAAAIQGVRWLPNATCSDNFFLINEDVVRGAAAMGLVPKEAA